MISGENISNKELEMTLTQVMNRLGYSDLRSAVKWCKDHKVIVFRQGKRRLVNSTQFVVVFYRPMIEQLKKLYPKKWLEMFQSFIQSDFEGANNLLTDRPSVLSLLKRYSPKSDSSKKLLTD